MGRTWDARQRARGLTALALLLFLGAAAVLAVPYRHSLATTRAYEAASQTRGIPAVVRKLENHSNGRGGHYWVEVTGPPSVSGRIDLDDSEPVLSRLHKGDRIGVVVWHGHRTDITFRGNVQQTTDSPTKYPALYLGSGLTLLDGGVLALYCAGRLRRRMPESDEPGVFDEFPLTGRMIVGAGVVTVASGLVTVEEHEGDPLEFVGTWIPLALIGLAVWAVRRWFRNRWLD
ncbi:hypothetical protein [Streptomyces sp. NPDC002265]|uniref:hypothetical protein n=1 Tax=Streptomyces sp. NPDC002265 TaxID=3154415 RepID=UPI003327CAE9